jgi:hypothetical protein
VIVPFHADHVSCQETLRHGYLHLDDIESETDPGQGSTEAVSDRDISLLFYFLRGPGSTGPQVQRANHVRHDDGGGRSARALAAQSRGVMCRSPRKDRGRITDLVCPRYELGLRLVLLFLFFLLISESS